MLRNEVANKVIELFDKSILLGAAWDCMEDVERSKFKAILITFLEEL